MSLGKRTKVILASGLGLLIVVVVALLVVTVYLPYRAEQQTRINESFRAESSSLFQEGETFRLDAAEDEKGFQYGNYVAGLPWYKGSMEVRVVDASEFATPAAAGVPDSAIMKDASAEGSTQDTSFVLLELELHNIDASPLPGLLGYYISSFKLRVRDEPSINGVVDYFDGTAAGADAKESYLFTLREGETKTFKVGYELPAQYSKNALSLSIGDSSTDKYKVSLNVEHVGTP